MLVPSSLLDFRRLSVGVRNDVRYPSIHAGGYFGTKALNPERKVRAVDVSNDQ